MRKALPPWVQGLAVAVGFLTVLPTPAVDYQPGTLGRAGRWFPVVGVLIGLLLVGGHWCFAYLFPLPLAAVLTTTLWATLTGGLHLDGLADCCDGLLAPVAPERRLEIMRDPRTGAFAVIGLVLFLLLKTTAIATLPLPLPALLLAPTWARWLLLWLARQPTARRGGLGAEFSNHLTTQRLVIALIAPLVLLVLFFQLRVLLALLAGLAVTWLVGRGARARLGGTTGDVYGLTVELSELSTLLIFAATLSG
jgi:adenosylcobinamide-GDP ribazoletransferase